jgi:hypothetical protein
MLVRAGELCGTVAHTSGNAFTAEIVKIKADIELLERFRHGCSMVRLSSRRACLSHRTFSEGQFAGARGKWVATGEWLGSQTFLLAQSHPQVRQSDNL